LPETAEGKMNRFALIPAARPGGRSGRDDKKEGPAILISTLQATSRLRKNDFSANFGWAGLALYEHYASVFLRNRGAAEFFRSLLELERRGSLPHPRRNTRHAWRAYSCRVRAYKRRQAETRWRSIRYAALSDNNLLSIILAAK
jgi:hypothetical protein